MSTSNASGQQSRHPAPFALKRRRTLMACLNCRKRKMRCITTEQPPRNPCARCTKKHLHCEYVSATEQDGYISSPQMPEADFPSPSSSAMSSPSASGTPPPAHPIPSSSRESGVAAPSLPYTGPPPANRRPRAPHLAQAPYHLHSPQAPQYLTSVPASPRAPGPIPQSHSLTYAPMPFFADTSMPAPESENTFEYPEPKDPGATDDASLAIAVDLADTNNGGPLTLPSDLRLFFGRREATDIGDNLDADHNHGIPMLPSHWQGISGQKYPVISARLHRLRSQLGTGNRASRQQENVEFLRNLLGSCEISDGD
ncbi:hypothetical protein B0H13DRAFT_1902341 [Mycena leptocephala]|nr:hypothetical protein B0H13DRAFT_1902341 [Mycena leptocephala]